MSYETVSIQSIFIMQLSLFLSFYDFVNIFLFDSIDLAMPIKFSKNNRMTRSSNWIGINFFLGQSNATSIEVYFEARTSTKNVWSIFIQEALKYNRRW